MEAHLIRMLAKTIGDDTGGVRRGVRDYLTQEGTFAEVFAAEGEGISPIGITASLAAFGAYLLGYSEEEIVTILTKLTEDGVI